MQEMTNVGGSELNRSQLKENLIAKDEKPQQQKAGVSDYMLMLGQIGLLLIWTFFAQYDNGVLPGTNKAATNSNVYACF